MGFYNNQIYVNYKSNSNSLIAWAFILFLFRPKKIGTY